MDMEEFIDEVLAGGSSILFSNPHDEDIPKWKNWMGENCFGVECVIILMRHMVPTKILEGKTCRLLFKNKCLIMWTRRRNNIIKPINWIPMKTFTRYPLPHV